MRDTPRGLVATVGDSSFSGSELRPSAQGGLARVAAVVGAHPGLRVDVEGHSDRPATAAIAERRAEAVERILLAQGLSPDRISARGLGDSQPAFSNATPEGREQNRRVEIVISGAPIGSLPYWDHTYSLAGGAGH